jgi:cysteine-rich repeat protein
MRTPPAGVLAMLLALTACGGGSSDSPPVTPVTPDPSASCGDGAVDGAEQCDDGNHANLDGCDASCGFEQVLRASQLSLEYDTATCAANAFGSAVLASFAQDLVNAHLSDAVRSGSLGLVLWLRGLDDLTGGADTAVEAGVFSASVPPAELSFDNSAQRDVWFMADDATLDDARVPRARLAGAIAGTMFTAGPGPMPLPMTILGDVQVLDLVDARISFQAGGLSAPAVSSGGSPGHLSSEHLSSGLRSFDEATGGKVCGAIRARSLTTVPIPELLASACGYGTDQFFLDLLVGGCGELSAATQPDAMDPAAAALGAGGPYQLVFDPEAKAVTGCQDKTGAIVNFDACLDAAAYSSAFTFAAERVIVRPACGDGAVAAGEACDDGNLNGGDGCGVCTVDPGWTCTGSPSVCTTTCGDGDLDAGEACEDGNRNFYDGCSGGCTVEEGWSCTGVPSVCEAVACGDGIVAGSETCDDANSSAGDGCSDGCTAEEGWFCYDSPSLCTTVCGDGTVSGAEQCDDGNGDLGDGCDFVCAVEFGWTCTGAFSQCLPVCGDGIVMAAEACDDGGTEPLDGCDSSCRVESGWTCPPFSACVPVFCATCDDAIACTMDVCFAETLTCEHTPDNSFCEDGNTCTTGACDAVVGCIQADVPDDTACPIGDGQGVCLSGVCVSTL